MAGSSLDLDGRIVANGAVRDAARAEIVVGAPRTRIWEAVVRVQPRFAEYAKKTEGREIPVVVLKEAAS